MEKGPRVQRNYASDAVNSVSTKGPITERVARPIAQPENREQEHATWQAFDFALRAYLVALDEGLQNDFGVLRQNPETSVKMDEMEDGIKKRGTILYAVLTSLVQGRPQKILKSIQQGNGFECYRVLAAQATPQLRTRALALLQSIPQDTFSRTAALTENLQRLDGLVKEYEGTSGGKEVGDDILVGVLLKNAPAQMRNWLLGHLQEDTPYSQVREAVRSSDLQTYKWADSISYYQKHHERTSTDVVPMEVDRMEKGGKSKGKGKKGKELEKTKNEGKGARQVDQPGSGTQLSATGSTVSSTTAGPSASQVRRIDPNDPLNGGVIYDLADEENKEVQDTAFNEGSVRAMKFEVHHMDKDDELDDWTYSPYLESCSPPATRITSSFTAEDGAQNQHHEHMDHSAEGTCDPTDWQVRAAYRPLALVEAILDSGSDMTVFADTWYYVNGIPTYGSETDRHVTCRWPQTVWNLRLPLPYDNDLGV